MIVYVLAFFLSCIGFGMILRSSIKDKSLGGIIGAVLFALVIACLAEYLGVIAFAFFIDCLVIPCESIIGFGVVFITMIVGTGISAILPWEKWQKDKDEDPED
jgi:hypothetical protein